MKMIDMCLYDSVSLTDVGPAKNGKHRCDKRRKKINLTVSVNQMDSDILILKKHSLFLLSLFLVFSLHHQCCLTRFHSEYMPNFLY